MLKTHEREGTLHDNNQQQQQQQQQQQGGKQKDPCFGFLFYVVWWGFD